MTPFHLAQLRHLYAQMVSGHVKSPRDAAVGLLASAIADEERQQRREAFACDDSCRGNELGDCTHREEGRR